MGLSIVLTFNLVFELRTFDKKKHKQDQECVQTIVLLFFKILNTFYYLSEFLLVFVMLVVL